MQFKDYLNLKKQIENKYRSDLAAVDSLWNTYGSKESAEQNEKRSMADGIREVIKALGDGFSVSDVNKGLIDLGYEGITTPQLSSALNRLLRKGEISVLEAGKGRQPSKYKISTEINKNNIKKVFEVDIEGEEDFSFSDSDEF